MSAFSSRLCNRYNKQNTTKKNSYFKGFKVPIYRKAKINDSIYKYGGSRQHHRNNGSASETDYFDSDEESHLLSKEAKRLQVSSTIFFFSLV
ncbi:hypothetical protein CDAR_545811 [Caerostris darwini]|uniref:Uncharacterized protein n=1 Tax=Caerostris darwini TaxID=1538125 RepID=A0AAV4WUH9_9ARAC|nr:hypothetical protein CDAR_545811 [Caerostris darwini]